MLEQSVTRQVIQDWLVENVARRLGVPESEIPVHVYIDELELDSSDAADLLTSLERWFGAPLDVTAVWRNPTLAELAGYLAREYARGGPAATVQRNGSLR